MTSDCSHLLLPPETAWGNKWTKKKWLNSVSIYSSKATGLSHSSGLVSLSHGSGLRGVSTSETEELHSASLATTVHFITQYIYTPTCVQHSIASWYTVEYGHSTAAKCAFIYTVHRRAAILYLYNRAYFIFVHTHHSKLCICTIQHEQDRERTFKLSVSIMVWLNVATVSYVLNCRLGHTTLFSLCLLPFLYLLPCFAFCTAGGRAVNRAG